jgi:hypothetical protein
MRTTSRHRSACCACGAPPCKARRMSWGDRVIRPDSGRQSPASALAPRYLLHTNLSEDPDRPRSHRELFPDALPPRPGHSRRRTARAPRQPGAAQRSRATQGQKLNRQTDDILERNRREHREWYSDLPDVTDPQAVGRHGEGAGGADTACGGAQPAGTGEVDRRVDPLSLPAASPAWWRPWSRRCPAGCSPTRRWRPAGAGHAADLVEAGAALTASSGW